jgi:DNA-binding NarL/FixJ family response regulator
MPAPVQEVQKGAPSHQEASALEESDIEQNPTRPTLGSVLAVDDQPAFRSAVRRLIAATPNLLLVGEADSGEAAVALTRELEPDLVLMDVRMPGIGGIAATREIKAIRDSTVVVLVSTTHPDELPYEADECNADEIVWKGDLRRVVLENIWSRHGRANL